ncbi:MAG: hypothetical protein V3573_06775 [Desulfovibrionaceae bacterium]
MIPNSGKARLRPDLAVMVHETMTGAPAKGFVASVIAPYFPVATQSADFPVLPAAAAFNVENVHRASGSGYSRSSEIFEAGYYSCRERGHEQPVDDRFKAIYRSVVDMDAAALDLCMGKVLRAYEVEVAGKITKASNFLNSGASVKWDVSATADPKADIDAAREIGRKKGIVYNRLVISWPTYLNLIKVKKVIDAVTYIFPDTKRTGTIGLTHLEAYLDIPIVLAGALANGAKRGKNPDLQDIWPDTVAVLARVADAGSDITEPSIARTFLWNEGSTSELIVEEYYEEQTRSSIIRVRHDIDVRLLKSYDEDGNIKTDISRNCGHVITGIKTS